LIGSVAAAVLGATIIALDLRTRSVTTAAAS
jgi:hypothetical protein